MADYFQVKNQNIFNPPANTSLGNTSTQFSNVYVQNNLVVGNVSVTSSTIITPRVTTITYPGNDTAADTAGGQTITLTGSGFVAGAGILINSITVSVVSVVSSTVITFTSPANTTGSYVLYVINSDGSTAISIPGIQYSGTPAWTTTAGSLGSVYEYSPISNATTATGDGSITYSVFSGTLPTSSSLNTSTGVITGTSPASAGATTYTFVIRATDAQLQDSDRSFSITVNIDPVTWTSPADNSTVTLNQNAASTTALSATSAAGKAITYTSTALPAGLSISGAAVTGTPTVLGTTATTFTATAADTSRTTTAVINWTISVAADPNFPYTTLLLSGAAATETFVADASVNNFPLTIVGDTKPNNFNPYTPGYYSVSFNGSSSIGTFTGPTIGTGDYTIEFWVYFNVIGTDQDFYQTYSGSTLNIFLEFDGAVNKIRHVLRNDAGTSNFDFNSTSSLVAGTWYHIAFVLNGTSAYTFINGNCTTLGATATSSGTRSGTYTNTLMGALYSGARYLNGNMSNFRLVKGTALYTSNFTPSTIPLTAISGTALLLCQSNRFVDNSTNAFTPTQAGNLQIQSFTPFVPNAQYATQGSTYFDGNADYLSASSNAAFTFGTGAFTIEAWIYPTVYGPTIGNWIYSNISANVGNSEIGLILLNAGTICLSTWNTYIAISTLTAPLNVWSHVVGSFDGTTYRVFVNGVLSGTSTTVQTLSGTGGAYIGTAGVAGISLFTGYLSNLRIVKGTAVYTGTFAVPAAPLSATQSSGTNIAAITGSQTRLLTCQTNQPASNSMFLDSSTNAFAVTRAGNTSAGTFTPYGANWSNYFDGTGANYLSVAGPQNFYDGNPLTVQGWFFASASSDNSLVTNYENSGQGWSVTLYAGKLSVNLSGDAFDIVGTTTVLLNTWNHFALSGTAGSWKLFLNGLQEGSTYTGGVSLNTNVGLLIGGLRWSGANYSQFNGYISNVHVARSLVYTSNFSPATAPLTPIASTYLLTCNSNSINDTGPNNKSIAPYTGGTVKVQRFSPFSPQTQTAITHSAYFDGTGDYLSVPSNSSSSFGTSNFTVECWVYMTANSSYRMLLGNGSSYLCFVDGAPNAYYSGVSISSSGTVPLNTWTHVAFVRISGTMYFYINGVLSGSGAFAGTWGIVGVSNIGYSSAYAGLYYYAGYLSNLRIVNGVAVYTAGFTVPTAPLSATQSAGTYITAITGTQTSLLTCQSPTFTDNSTNAFAITAFGEAKPRTLNPFGFTNTSAAYSAATYGGSAYFDGASDTLTLPSNAAFAMGTGNFTIEFWINTSNIAQTGYVLQTDSASNTLYVSLSGSTIRLTNVSSAFAVTPTLLSNTWYHIAVVRTGTSSVIYTNGIAGTPVTCSIDFTQAGPSIGNNNYLGYISNLRIVKGVAVYTSNFVPPTAPVTAITNTSLLLNMTTAGVYDSASGNNLETVADAKRVATHTPYAGSYYSNYFNGTTDYLSVPANAAFQLGTGDFTWEMWVYPTANVSTNGMLFGYRSGSSTSAFLFYNATQIIFGTDSADLITYTGVPSIGSWTHLAISRVGTALKMFVNGAVGGSVTNTTNFSDASLRYIGAMSGNQYYFPGYISNVRIVKGVAVYTGTFTPPTAPLTSTQGAVSLSPPPTVEYLVVAGGGGGASAISSNTRGGGGGGAGGFRTASGFAVAANSAITVTVGAAGTNGTALGVDGGDGTASIFSTITSAGGGGGGSEGRAGRNGGSGGGGSGGSAGGLGNTPSTSPSQGNNGGASSSSAVTAGGSGGGAGGAGTSGASYGYSSIVPIGPGSNSSITGTGITYSAGGTGGGSSGDSPTNATVNSGNGGQGGGNPLGGLGGSGVVIIRYADTYAAATCTGSPEITVAGGYRIYKFVTSGTMYITFNTETIAAITGSQTSLLTCQSNRLIDNSTNLFAITRAGSTSVQSFNPFQRNSAATLYFDGTGDALAIPYNPAFNFGAGNFTIEFWMYVTATPSTEQYFLAVGPAGSGGVTRGWRMAAHNGTAAGIYFSPTGIGSEVLLGSFPNASAWHHIAIVRNSTTITGYVDGIALGTTINASTTAITNITSGDYSFVGGMLNSGATPRLFYNGYIDDLRITKGVARYTGTFTPSTSAFITK